MTYYAVAFLCGPVFLGSIYLERLVPERWDLEPPFSTPVLSLTDVLIVLGYWTMILSPAIVILLRVRKRQPLIRSYPHILMLGANITIHIGLVISYMLTVQALFTAD